MTKEVTAMHEAGHVLVVLATPLRDYVEKARVFKIGEDWLGEQHMTSADRVPIDPNGVLEFAKGLAGPLTHLYFYPEATDPTLKDLITQTGSLLRATRAILDDPKMRIQTNWWPDLEHWRIFCLKVKFPNRGKDYLAVESELQAFLSHPSVQAVAKDIQQRLVARDELKRDELLEINVAHLPTLKFPSKLSIFN